MARPTKPQPDSAPTRALSDVLVYNETKQPISISYYNKRAIKSLEDLRSARGAANLVEHTRFTPGLYLVRASAWPKVRQELMWTRMVTSHSLVPVAGHQEGLAADWQAVSTRRLMEMVGRTADPRTLIFLYDLENGADQPRIEVSNAIDQQRKKLELAIAQHLDRTGT